MTRARDRLVPRVDAVLRASARAVQSGASLDRDAVRMLAAELVARVTAKLFTLEQRSYSPGLPDDAQHATNTALIAAAIALEAGHPAATCEDVAAAALMHDFGLFLLPEASLGIPEPLLDDAQRALRHEHPLLGARALLASGCPPLWVAAALEHHRGMDGKGYPALASKAAPSPLVRIVALASYVDRKRAAIDGKADTPEAVLTSALALEGRFFEPGMVRRFVRALGVFPPGTTVELSGQQPALVVQANATAPMRPQVVVLAGAGAGAVVDLAAVDVAERRYASSIVRAISPPLLVRVKAKAARTQAPRTRKHTPEERRAAATRKETPPASSGRTRAARAPTQPPVSGRERARSTPPEATRSRPPESTRSRAPVSERPVSRRRDPRTEEGGEPPRAEAVEPARRRAPAVPVAAGLAGPLGATSVLEITVNASYLKTVQLDPRESAVLSHVDGTRTLAEIAELLGATAAKITPTVTHLLARGVVRRH